MATRKPTAKKQPTRKRTPKEPVINKNEEGLPIPPKDNQIVENMRKRSGS